MSGFFDSKSNNFEELVYRGVESDELDYKAHMSWHTMSRAAKGKLLRHLIAFANTKGGSLVIGVGEDRFGNPNLRTGVSMAEAGSFDPSAVGNFLNSYVEPAIDFTIERPVIRGKKYVIFTVKPFKELPHVCTNTIEGEVQSGIFYIRTVEASSRPARRALEMQSLILRAMRNEREKLSNILREILSESPLPDNSACRIRCNDAIEGSEHYFRRRTRSFELPQLKLTVSPARFVHGTYPKETLRRAMEGALRPTSGLIRKDEITALPTPGSIRFMSRDSQRMWQFFDSGLFCFFSVLKEPEINFDDLMKLCVISTAFFARLYRELDADSELLSINLELINIDKLTINCAGGKHPVTGNAATGISCSAAELAGDMTDYTTRMVSRLAEALHLPGSVLEKIPDDVASAMEKK